MLSIFSHAVPVTDLFDYCFAENGLVAYKDGKQFASKVSSGNCFFVSSSIETSVNTLDGLNSQTLGDEIPNEKLKKFINFTLRYLSEIDCPVKRCVLN